MNTTNTFLLFCILFALCSKCSLTDIFSTVDDTMRQPDMYIKPYFKLDTIERIYIKYILSGLKEDPVCSLSKSKKIALCERIFQLTYYKDRNIHLNKVAFYINSPTCEKRPIGFRTQIFFLDEIIMQEMYTCYGRHNPVRTNYLTDDYYDKFYVSAGLTKNSVIVYVREFNAEYDWYNVHSYLENFLLSELPQTLINVAVVKDELELNDEMISTSNHEKIEYIYIRENDVEDTQDPICDLDITKKAGLCELIFNQYVYKMTFWMTLSKAGFFYIDVTCSMKKIKIRYSERYKGTSVSQKMYPCFGRSRLTSGNILRDQNYFQSFYVSKGPRKNSVFVYTRKITATGADYYLIELLENVYIDDLKSIAITSASVSEESWFTQYYMQKIHWIGLVMKQAENKKVNVIIFHTLNSLGKQIISKTKISEEEFERLGLIYDGLEQKILNVVRDAKYFHPTRLDLEMRAEHTMDDKKSINYIRTLYKEIKEIIHRGELEEEDKRKQLDLVNEIEKVFEKRLLDISALIESNKPT